jgi:hypothetical protein
MVIAAEFCLRVELCGKPEGIVFFRATIRTSRPQMHPGQAMSRRQRVLVPSYYN